MVCDTFLAAVFEREWDFARALALQAGELALRLRQQGVQVEVKSDSSPVTQADRECERLIARRIAEEFPQDGILGEEGSAQASANGRRWIIDPIDGTRDFLRGNDLWSNLIALEVNGEVVLGVCHLAARGEIYSALRGAGAWKNGTRIHCSEVERAGEAVLSINGLNYARETPFAPRLLEWSSQFWSVRSMGGCLDAMMLADGRFDLWIECRCEAWDLAALGVILEEAGARFLSFSGQRTIYGGNCIAFTPGLEQEARGLLSLP